MPCGRHLGDATKLVEQGKKNDTQFLKPNVAEKLAIIFRDEKYRSWTR